jgi:predicted amidohydrolase YtcJ
MLRIASGAGGVPAAEWDRTWNTPRIPLKERGPSEEAAAVAEGEDLGTYLAVKYGWSLANIHSQGDRGNDAFLQQVEEGMRDRLYDARRQRFGLDHAQMITAHSPKGNQIERIAKIGRMVPSLNIGKMFREGSYEAERQLTDDPNILKMSQIKIYEAKWGREQVYQMLPAKSLINAGVRPSIEADSWRWPDTYPLWSMEKMITRKDDFDGDVWGNRERVTRQEALWMATKWAADYTSDADVMGSIEPGKYADLLILDRDYMTVPEDEISHIRVLATYLEGRVVYDAAKDGPLDVIYPPSRNHWTKRK